MPRYINIMAATHAGVAPDDQYRIQRKANAIARAFGAGRATEIRLGERDRVLAHTRRGYRKSSTGEYVAKAYLSNFGWKNTYYQHAKTIVEVAA